MTSNDTNAKGTKMTTTKTRAKRGGEVGMNGEFYAGGTFLPNTKLGKMSSSRPAGSRKVEIEPYIWVESNGRKPLYSLVRGTVGCLTREGAVPNNDTAIAYLGYTREQAQTICDRWNAGERWL